MTVRVDWKYARPYILSQETGEREAGRERERGRWKRGGDGEGEGESERKHGDILPQMWYPEWILQHEVSVAQLLHVPHLQITDLCTKETSTP